jgi:hypothetical protein
VTLAKSFAFAAVIYAFAWLGTYLALMGGDMTYLVDYFVLSWSGGLEIPAFIQLVAIVFGLLAWIAAYFRIRKVQR